MTGQDEREAIDRGDEQVKIIADAWMLHQGYTQEEIEASVDDLDHSLCEMVPGVGWDCIDEDGTHRHPEYAALWEASEMANVALDALAQAGFHLTPTDERLAAVRALHFPLDPECTAIGHRAEPHQCPDEVTLCAECGKDYPCPTIDSVEALRDAEHELAEVRKRLEELIAQAGHRAPCPEHGPNDTQCDTRVVRVWDLRALLDGEVES